VASSSGRSRTASSTAVQLLRPGSTAPRTSTPPRDQLRGVPAPAVHMAERAVRHGGGVRPAETSLLTSTASMMRPCPSRGSGSPARSRRSDSICIRPALTASDNAPCPAGARRSTTTRLGYPPAHRRTAPPHTARQRIRTPHKTAVKSSPKRRQRLQPTNRSLKRAHWTRLPLPSGYGLYTRFLAWTGSPVPPTATETLQPLHPRFAVPPIWTAAPRATR
jgi:hypothetical protein